MSTQKVADRLVALCREGQWEQAQRELYADDAVSIEMPKMAEGGSGMGNVQGLPAILEKGKRFMESVVEMHGAEVGDPIVAGSWFSCAMMLEATFKEMGRVKMHEICVYRVRDGKIVSEQFFYDEE